MYIYGIFVYSGAAGAPAAAVAVLNTSYFNKPWAPAQTIIVMPQQSSSLTGALPRPEALTLKTAILLLSIREGGSALRSRCVGTQYRRSTLHSIFPAYASS